VIILQEWYRHFYKRGAADLANDQFSNYTPAYLYLLWMTRLLSDWFDSLAAIKLIPTVFDFLSAYAIFLLARIKYDDDKPYLLAAIFFTLPTILFNSSGWGQIESLYASFLLLCAYFLLKHKPFFALLAFGYAFSVKAQSIFLLPFLGILFLKGKISWRHFLLVPAVYLILGLPAAALGRGWLSILLIYSGQVQQFESLSMNAPNLYIFISNSFYEIGAWVGMGIFAAAMAAWGWVNWRAKTEYGSRQIMLMALASLALVPFTLPKMHDRYFYLADVFSFAAAIFVPEIRIVPVLYQIISSLTYSAFVFDIPNTPVKVAAILNTGTVAYILYRQYRSLREGTQS
jgi:Gpi18-like mannosyltransferase